MAANVGARPARDATWGLARGHEIDPTLVVIEPLGGGSRYEVFEAWDRELFCKVAVKVLRADRIDSERSLASFEREAMMAEGLRHPNLVRLLRWSPALPRPYIVLELISAPMLSTVLEEEGAISVPEICLLAVRMLAALHYLHRRSLLHLDVKPSNVSTGEPPRLLDLSVARFAPGALKLRHPIGTPQYMAPEQCEHAHVTPATDIFGLGATLYEALTGMAPFRPGVDGAEAREDRYPQLVEEPVPLRELMPAVPAPLDAFVMSCLARDPARRPASAVDAATALHRILEGFGHRELLAWPRGVDIRPRDLR
ncbi:MAG TPA: serine/threonine-protein kinase [Candidatus Limnocylindria bacterium]|nr:serine/threonine-protein kinase [Candidatus Limnocylindria bacterium]